MSAPEGNAALIGGESDPMLQSAARDAEALEDERERATAFVNMGRDFAAAGDYAAALEWLARALSLAESLEDDALAANALNSVGGAHLEAGRYPEAVDAYERSLARWRAAGDSAGEASVLNNLGMVRYELGDHEGALALYDQAWPLLDALDDQRRLAFLLDNRAQAFEGLERWGEARSAYLAAAGTHVGLDAPLQAELSYQAALTLCGSQALEIEPILREMTVYQLDPAPALLRAGAALRDAGGPEHAARLYDALERRARATPEAKAVAAAARRKLLDPDHPGGGLMILTVEADTQAIDLGLAVGEVLLRYDGRPLGVPDDLLAAIRGSVGRSPAVEVLGAEGPREITAAPGRLGVTTSLF